MEPVKLTNPSTFLQECAYSSEQLTGKHKYKDVLIKLPALTDEEQEELEQFFMNAANYIMPTIEGLTRDELAQALSEHTHFQEWMTASSHYFPDIKSLKDLRPSQWESMCVYLAQDFVAGTLSAE